MNTIHVVPVDDIIDHDTTSDHCACGPSTEAVYRDDGSNGWICRHAALDGREQQEQATGRGTGKPWWFGRDDDPSRPT